MSRSLVGVLSERIKRAAAILGARPVDGEWRYRADETGTDWIVSTADLLKVLDFVEPGERMTADRYAEWCNVTTAREVRG